MSSIKTLILLGVHIIKGIYGCMYVCVHMCTLHISFTGVTFLFM